jgi:hypothetical protein
MGRGGDREGRRKAAGNGNVYVGVWVSMWKVSFRFFWTEAHSLSVYRIYEEGSPGGTMSSVLAVHVGQAGDQQREADGQVHGPQRRLPTTRLHTERGIRGQ